MKITTTSLCFSPLNSITNITNFEFAKKVHDYDTRIGLVKKKKASILVQSGSFLVICTKTQSI